MLRRSLLLWGLAACTQPEPEHTIRIEQPADTVAMPAPVSPREHQDAGQRSAGQRLYVPVYSSVTFGTGIKKAAVAVRLMVRNVSEEETFRLTRVDLYSSEGARIESVIQEPLSVTPLQTRSFLVEAEDLRAGAGGNFIVAWEADAPITPPMIETVNGYSEANRTFAFRAGSRVLSELAPSPELAE